MKYRAFLSYSRTDDRAANWLHRKLDRYRTPRALVKAGGTHGEVPKKLHPIFRDRSDLSGTGGVIHLLHAALDESESLIVLCSPTAATSHWVNEEVKRFQALGREDRIFPIIAFGLKDTDDVEGTLFPPALRGKGILAADLREIKLKTGQVVGDGKKVGLMKLTASLLGVPLDALMQRERRRQRTLTGLMATAAMVFAGLAVAAAGLGLLAQRNAAEAERQTIRAVAGEEDARNALARIMAERSVQARDNEDFLLGARYALAGWQSAPVNEPEYRVALARLLHDANQGYPLMRPDGRRMTGVRDVSFSPDGSHLLTLSQDGILRLWDTARRQETSHTYSADDPIKSAIFVDGGEAVAVLTQSGVLTIRAISSLTDGPVTDYEPVADSGDDIKSMSRELKLSPNGNRLAITDESGDLPRTYVADAATGLPLFDLGDPYFGDGDPLEPLFTEGFFMRGLAFSPNGQWIAAATESRIVIYHAATGDVVTSLGIEGFIASGVAFNPDSSALAVPSGDGQVELFQTQTWQRQRDLLGHARGVSIAEFSPDGARIASASSDETVRVWDAATGGEFRVIPHQGEVWSTAFHPDGRQIISGASDGEAKVWQAASGRDQVVARMQELRSEHGPLRNYDPEDRVASLAGHVADIVLAEFDPQGGRAVTLDRDGAVRLWDRSIGREMLRLDNLETDRAQFLATENLIALADRQGEITAWDITSGKPASVPQGFVFSDDTFDADHDRWQAMFETNPNGELYATYGDDQSELTFHQFSPNGMAVFTADWDDNVRVWDVATGQLITDLRGHDSWVHQAAFSADGNRLWTITEFGVLRVWDVRHLSRPMADLAKDACTRVLPPSAYVFSAAEIAADSLITDVWLRDGREDSDVCKAVLNPQD